MGEAANPSHSHAFLHLTDKYQRGTYSVSAHCTLHPSSSHQSLLIHPSFASSFFGKQYASTSTPPPRNAAVRGTLQEYLICEANGLRCLSVDHPTHATQLVFTTAGCRNTPRSAFRVFNSIHSNCLPQVSIKNTSHCTSIEVCSRKSPPFCHKRSDSIRVHRDPRRPQQIFQPSPTICLPEPHGMQKQNSCFRPRSQKIQRSSVLPRNSPLGTSVKTHGSFVQTTPVAENVKERSGTTMQPFPIHHL